MIRIRNERMKNVNPSRGNFQACDPDMRRRRPVAVCRRATAYTGSPGDRRPRRRAGPARLEAPNF
jgi:hypothetical protein